MASLSEKWVDELSQGRDESPDAPGWVEQLRAAGTAAFARHGLPHRKVEDWKYTSLKLLEARGHRLAGRSESGSGVLPGCPEPLSGKQDSILQVVNGQLVADPGVEGKIKICALQQILKGEDDQPWHREILESLSIDGASRAFSALNTSMLTHGMVLDIPAGTDAGTLLVQFSFTGEPPAAMFNFRVIIRLGDGASLRLIEQFESHRNENRPDPAHALNLVSQIRVGEGASFHHLRVQHESEDSVLITRTECEMHANAIYLSSFFDFGGALVRHDNQVQLLGEGSEAAVNGAFVQDGERHLDHHVLVDHVAGGCRSGQFFRGVLGDRSRGVFNGKARIRKGADGSSVRQSNANLLLSPMAEIDTKPELEIYADEVEASHGATVGQLDEDAVFYLRSRGIDETSARAMLTGAFCKAVLDRAGDLPESLAKELVGRIDAVLSDVS